MIEVQFVKLDERALPPTQAYPGDAGWDLHALEDTRVVWSSSKPITDVRTGLAVAIPDGYFGRIVHRSSTARKKGLFVVEGTIDSGFRGELFVGVYGAVEMPPLVEAGMSIGQLIIQPVVPVKLSWVEELPSSARGTNGFGSSGR